MFCFFFFFWAILLQLTCRTSRFTMVSLRPLAVSLASISLLPPSFLFFHRKAAKSEAARALHCLRKMSRKCKCPVFIQRFSSHCWPHKALFTPQVSHSSIRTQIHTMVHLVLRSVNPSHAHSPMAQHQEQFWGLESCSRTL